MDSSSQKEEGKKKVTDVKTFVIPFPLKRTQENLTINTNSPNQPSKEQIINQAFNFHSQGKISEAAKLYQYFIHQGFSDHRVFSNYGVILKNLGKLKEAELSTRNAIKLNPTFAEAHSNLGSILRDLGKLKEAELSTRKAIKLNSTFTDSYLNLGGILRDLGKLKEAELSTRKVIELNPNYSIAHDNLGSILIDLGNLKEAEKSFLKAIEINPDLAKTYYSLSVLKYSNTNNKLWKDKLFSKSILNNKSKKDQVDIYFARANIRHQEKNYEEGSKFLKLANELKLSLIPSNYKNFINKSKILLIESNKKELNPKEHINPPESIFIVGMLRSGSTLLESIISMNPSVDDLGEVHFLEQSFLEQKTVNREFTLAELYWKKAKNYRSEFNITTNKWLYNYQYTGIIASRIPRAKIIHCFRNPLDNILSIYRAHFSKGNEYSSSLIDCTKIYLDQEALMAEYKNRYRTQIYDLNYDLLVTNPKNEVKSLISWLGWEWDDSYLSPHLNPRSVLTSSKVQVRSPINSKSIGGWKKYKEMLKPAIEILTQNDRSRDLIS